MKKIQVSTVPMNADVQVVFVNASFITKALRAQIAASKIAERMVHNGSAQPVMETVIDENGEPKVDEKGCVIEKPVLDEKGNQVWKYQYHRLDDEEVENFYNNVAPFLKELVDAFEE